MDNERSEGAINPVPPRIAEQLERERVTQEQKQLRRLQMMMNMCMQVIAQDGSLTLNEATQIVADSREAALAMFPGKELAYDLIWRPRFQRLLVERFRLQ